MWTSSSEFKTDQVDFTDWMSSPLCKLKEEITTNPEPIFLTKNEIYHPISFSCKNNQQQKIKAGQKRAKTSVWQKNLFYTFS